MEYFNFVDIVIIAIFAIIGVLNAISFWMSFQKNYRCERGGVRKRNKTKQPIQIKPGYHKTIAGHEKQAESIQPGEMGNDKQAEGAI